MFAVANANPDDTSSRGYTTPKAAPLGTLQGAELVLGSVGLPHLVRQLDRYLDDAQLAPVRISWSIPDYALVIDRWRERLDRIRCGRAPWQAMAGARVVEALDLVLDLVDVPAGFVSLDLSRVSRPHLYGAIFVPLHITPRHLDDVWSMATGAVETGRLEDRVCYLGLRRKEGSDPADTTWHRLVRARDGLRDDHDYLRKRLGRDLKYVLSYALKGSDRPHDYQLPAALPTNITQWPASAWAVSARGLTVPLFDSAHLITGVELGELDPNEAVERALDSPDLDLGWLIAARRASTRSRVISTPPERLPLCMDCGELLAPFRYALDIEVDRHIRLHRPRRNRRYCAPCKAHRDSRPARVKRMNAST